MDSFVSFGYWTEFDFDSEIVELFSAEFKFF